MKGNAAGSSSPASEPIEMELTAAGSTHRLLLPSDDAESHPPVASGYGTEPQWAALQEPSYTLTFRNITYSVKPRRRRSERLTILDNVSGHCESGRVLSVRMRSPAASQPDVLVFCIPSLMH